MDRRILIAGTGVLVIGFLIWFFVFRHEPYRLGPSFLHVHDRVKRMATQVLGDDATPLYIIDDFLSAEECDGILRDTAGTLTPSTITRESEDKDFRTSKTAFFTEKGSLPKIWQKGCDIMGIDKKWCESPQVQHYDVGQRFKAHQDYFHDNHDTEHLVGGQRTWTLMVFLNNVEDGGETHFPTLDESIKPKKGRAAIWSSIGRDGLVDPRTLHAGTPVKAGYKDIITLWFRDKPQQ